MIIAENQKKYQVVFPFTPVADGNLNGDRGMERDIIVGEGEDQSIRKRGKKKKEKERRIEEETKAGRKQRKEVGGIGGGAGDRQLGTVRYVRYGTIRYSNRRYDGCEE